MKFFHTLVMALALFALAGCGGSKNTGLPATQNPPTFPVAAVNDFVKNFSQNANDVVAAAKTKENAVIAAAAAKFNETLAKAQPLAGALKQDELAKLNDWVKTLIQQTQASVSALAAPQNPPTPSAAATQNPPTFSVAAVNDFVKTFSQNANDIVAAAKTKDNAMLAAAATKFNETLAKAQPLAGALKPDELAKLNEWVKTLVQQTQASVSAAQQAAPAAK